MQTQFSHPQAMPMPVALSTPAKMRLLVVDHQPVVCEGLRSIVLRSPRLDVAGVCWTCEAALRLAIRTAIDLILIDSRMSPMTGLQLLLQLNRSSRPCKVLFLANSEVEEEVFEAIEAGAVGYLSKSMPPAEMLKAILAAASGEKVFPVAMSSQFDARRSRRSLTARELEVLNLVSKGLSNKEVGHVLGLSQFTVRNQLKRICGKLDASDRTEAATTAMERGMIRQQWSS